MKNIAIAVLTRGYDDLKHYDTLIERNRVVYERLVCGSKFQFDNIIFHEGNIPKSHQDYISSKSRMPLVFKNVKETGSKRAFDDGKNLVNMELCPPTKLSSSFNVGYKHMCHFWAIDLFDYLTEYKYVIRIDEDVFILKMHDQILSDIVESQVKFCVPYVYDLLDDPNVTVGLEKLLNKFCTDNNIALRVPYKKVFAPNTNFMILDIEYYKNNTIVQKFLSEVEKSSGIYSNRWGDATLWAIILYVLQNEPFFVCDYIEYFHGSHRHHVNRK